MRYLLTCRLDDQAWGDLPSAQREALMQACLDFEREVSAGRRSVVGTWFGALAAAATAVPGIGPPPPIDDTCTEVPAVVDGCHGIECQDLEEAIAMARRLLTLPVGGFVEVRPVEQTTDGPAPAEIETRP